MPRARASLSQATNQPLRSALRAALPHHCMSASHPNYPKIVTITVYVHLYKMHTTRGNCILHRNTQTYKHIQQEYKHRQQAYKLNNNPINKMLRTSIQTQTASVYSTYIYTFFNKIYIRHPTQTKYKENGIHIPTPKQHMNRREKELKKYGTFYYWE
jgi:hypothetical protein